MRRTVLHLTTLHRGDDSRMVLKMARSTARRYPTTVLATPPFLPDPSLTFVPIPYNASLLKRLMFVHPRVLLHCLRIRPGIVHVHAPEALPIAWLLFLLGTDVIYDVYENMGKQLAGKTVNNQWLFRKVFGWFDRIARKNFRLIFAEDAYLASYPDLKKPFEIIHNFPDLSQLPAPETGAAVSFFYLGQLSKARCLDVMIRAAALLKQDYPDFRWHIFGKPGFDLSGWDDVYRLDGFEEVRENLIFYGQVSAPDAYAVGKACLAGIALLRPVGDFPDSYPGKIFEYMGMGLPVITSAFPLYRSVVDTHQCGFCLDPEDAEGLYEALRFFIEHPEARRETGQRGLDAVRRHYNWAAEEQKLFRLYETLT